MQEHLSDSKKFGCVKSHISVYTNMLGKHDFYRCYETHLSEEENRFQTISQNLTKLAEDSHENSHGRYTVLKQ
jgi:hypothetical protein